MEKISVVIPAFNEEKDIAIVINTAKKCEYVKEIIVVDNLSTDKTGEIALKEGAKVIKCDKQGKGYAMEKGMKEVTGDIVVFLDADISSYVEDVIYRLAKPIIEKDIDIGANASTDAFKKYLYEDLKLPVLKTTAKYQAAADIIIETDDKSAFEICEEIIAKARQ